MKKFDGDAGEFPPVRVGQFMMVNDGIDPDDMANMDDLYAECSSLDEQMAVLFDHPEILNNIFMGSLVSRRDNYVTLKDLDHRRVETRDFPFNRVMAVFGVIDPTDPHKVNSFMLSPEHLNELVAKTWMNVRWPRAE